MKGDDIAQRLLSYGVGVMRLMGKFAKDAGAKHVAQQLARSGRERTMKKLDGQRVVLTSCTSYALLRRRQASPCTGSDSRTTRGWSMRTSVRSSKKARS